MENGLKILVVDDDRGTRHLLAGMLKPLGYEIMTADNGREALRMTTDEKPDLILLDAIMPEMDGFATVQAIKENPNTAAIPVIMITSLEKTEDRVRALESGSNEILSKPVARTELQVRIKSLLEAKAYQDFLRDQHRALEKEVQRRTRALKDASLEAILRLTKAAEYKDQDTGVHIQRMSQYGYLLAEAVGMEPDWIETFFFATSMHDVGKIGIPDKILLKPGKLEPREWEVMQQHTTIGAKILEKSTSPVIIMGEVIARTHHERWDGKGYPDGIEGDNIPIEGRITAIADVFDALTSKRPYKEAFSIEKSLTILEEEKGKGFDPELVELFFSIEDKILKVHDSYADSGDSLFYKMAQAAGESISQE